MKVSGQIVPPKGLRRNLSHETAKSTIALMPENPVVPIMVAAADPDIFDDVVDETLLDEEDSVEESLRYEITSYGADYDVDGLVKRLKKGDIKIPAFQRGFVWPIKQASRFIESLLLGLPVPGIFLSKEDETNKLLVIDGQQRLTTLQAFYDGIFPSTKREFSLVDVQPGLEGKTYKTLEDEHRRVLENAIIHATVVKQTNPADGGSGIYKIFERLNSSGMLLSPQEIRTAIYGGNLSTLLSDLNKNPNWRILFGPVNKRMRDQELILRFFALAQTEKPYARPMKTFLNDFMNVNRAMSAALCKAYTEIFNKSVGVVFEHIGPKAFKPVSSFNAAVFDAILIAIARRLEQGPINDFGGIARAFEGVLANKDFQQWTSRSTADDETVKKRLQMATDAFSQVA
jgi:Protein of unknown function DUF262